MYSEHSEWTKVLENKFGDFASEEKDQMWIEQTRDMERGDPVVGTVLARTSFGLWVDIELDFPALIESIHIVGMNAEKYAKDDFYPVGTKIEAMIRGPSIGGHQIRLEQVSND